MIDFCFVDADDLTKILLDVEAKKLPRIGEQVKFKLHVMNEPYKYYRVTNVLHAFKDYGGITTIEVHVREEKRA